MKTQYKISQCVGWHEVWEVKGDEPENACWSLMAVCAQRERAQQIVNALNNVTELQADIDRLQKRSNILW